MPDDAPAIRLQKVLAQAGFGSRRKAEELIAAGRVTVDGKVVDLGARVDPATAKIAVDGERIITNTNAVTLAINKPRGMITALSDPHGRPTIADLLEHRTEHLFHVGRLDADTEGLLLVTNDGELANRLMHPRYEVPKTYVATVAGKLYPRMIKALLDGVELADDADQKGSWLLRPAQATKVKVLQTLGDQTLVELEIKEGRNRVVRRMFDAIERPVQRLVRTRIGPIKLGDQRPGTVRELSSKELGALMGAVGL